MTTTITTGTKQTFEGYCAWFKIDNQTFSLKEVESEEHAKWFEGCLTDAFLKLDGVTVHKDVKKADEA